MSHFRKTMNLFRRLSPGPVEVELDSSALRSVRYERHQRRLQVVFSRGTVYEYGSVEPGCFHELLSAPSAGRYFQKHIRGSYPYRRLT